MQAVHERWRPPDIRFVVVIGQKSRCNMDNSFDERCETDISDCFEDILEGEEEVFFGFI